MFSVCRLSDRWQSLSTPIPGSVLNETAAEQIQDIPCAV